MAKDKKTFNKNLMIMCIVPVLVLVVTMSIIGVSYAWFSDADETKIATLSLSTAETFQMTFEIVTKEDHTSTKVDNYQNAYVYNGQTAFDENGMLITAIHADEYKHYVRDDELWQKYMNDQAFIAPFELKLDTNTYRTDGGETKFIHSNEVDFNCKIDSVHIQNSKNSAIEINLPGNNGTPDDTTDDISVDDIKLGFTWFISGGPDGQLYTPYGRVYSTSPTTASRNGSIVCDDWTVPIATSGFNSDEEGNTFTFNIVFAPEILYWKQYGSNEVKNEKAGVAEYNETATDIYPTTFQTAKWDAINRYSSIIYSGSTYSFTVLLTVTKVVPIN